jgi:sec-independent protein translocase protein TatA
MGSMSIWHWLVVAIIVLVLFGGRGKISDIMGDFAKGIKSFKKGMADDEPAQAAAEPVKTIAEQANGAASKVSEKAS